MLRARQAQFAAQVVSQAQVDADAGDLKSKRALVAQQAALVAKKTIRAPFAGQLGITTVNPGQYLNPGDKLVTLQTHRSDLRRLQRAAAAAGAGWRSGQKVNADQRRLSRARRFTGKITAISPKVDPATRNVQIEATVANPKRELLPGMFANVEDRPRRERSAT